jgi:hypothetical protein
VACGQAGSDRSAAPTIPLSVPVSEPTPVAAPTEDRDAYAVAGLSTGEVISAGVENGRFVGAILNSTDGTWTSMPDPGVGDLNRLELVGAEDHVVAALAACADREVDPCYARAVEFRTWSPGDGAWTAISGDLSSIAFEPADDHPSFTALGSGGTANATFLVDGAVYQVDAEGAVKKMEHEPTLDAGVLCPTPHGLVEVDLMTIDIQAIPPAARRSDGTELAIPDELREAGDLTGYCAGPTLVLGPTGIASDTLWMLDSVDGARWIRVPLDAPGLLSAATWTSDGLVAGISIPQGSTLDDELTEFITIPEAGPEAAPDGQEPQRMEPGSGRLIHLVTAGQATVAALSGAQPGLTWKVWP